MRNRQADKPGDADPKPSRTEPEGLSLAAILMLERHPDEVAFVWSLVHDIMRSGIWLWHEADFQHAMHLLSFARFRLILLDATFAPRLSLRTLIRRVQAAAPATPVILRIPPEELSAHPDSRIYGVTAAVPKGIAGPTEVAIRQVLGLHRGRP
jgi:hypothetical protein